VEVTKDVNVYFSNKLPRIDPASFRVLDPKGESALISFRIGIDWSHTFPVPRMVARNSPSPPKTIVFRLPVVSISKSRAGSYATICRE
jgi:hypothetical protein